MAVDVTLGASLYHSLIDILVRSRLAWINVRRQIKMPRDTMALPLLDLYGNSLHLCSGAWDTDRVHDTQQIMSRDEPRLKVKDGLPLRCNKDTIDIQSLCTQKIYNILNVYSAVYPVYVHLARRFTY